MSSNIWTTLAPLPDDALVPVRWIRELLDGADAHGAVDPTADDVADMIGRAPSTIRGWCRDGRLSGAYKLGKQWRVPRESLRSLRNNNSAPQVNVSTRRPADLSAWRKVQR